MKYIFTRYRDIAMLCLCIICLFLFLIFLPKVFSDHYIFSQSVISETLATTKVKAVFVPSYVPTPKIVKGIYMTSWTASNNNLRGGLVKLVDDTELNTVVIDIKDYSGKIVFPIENNSALKSYGSEEVRIRDLPEFIESLHRKNIYVIGRIAVFQDAYFVKYRPDLAVKNKSGTEIWKDYKGISWIDAGSREYWDYIVLLAKEARKIGFDEVNFDYIRFPSDGNMQDISYTWSSTTPKSLVLKEFFQYLHENLQDLGLKISADIFGLVTSAKDDMGIGQILENVLPYFDYIDPMVYPSHYAPDFQGFKDPEAHPYDVVHFAMQSALERANKLDLIAASSTPAVENTHYGARLRPWLQDFGLKMDYGPSEVRAQIQATNDIGLSSWILWSASNKYTQGALSDK